MKLTRRQMVASFLSGLGLGFFAAPRSEAEVLPRISRTIEGRTAYIGMAGAGLALGGVLPRLTYGQAVHVDPGAGPSRRVQLVGEPSGELKLLSVTGRYRDLRTLAFDTPKRIWVHFDDAKEHRFAITPTGVRSKSSQHTQDYDKIVHWGDVVIEFGRIEPSPLRVI